MAAAAPSPHWERGFMCEMAKAIRWLDPQGLNDDLRIALEDGCTDVTTAFGTIRANATHREYRLCQKHFPLLNATPVRGPS